MSIPLLSFLETISMYGDTLLLILSPFLRILMASAFSKFSPSTSVNNASSTLFI